MKKKAIALLIIFLLLGLPLSISANVDYPLSYDQSGNLLQGIDKKYEYDGFNQLVKVKNLNNQLLEEYAYDQEGNRIKKVEYLPTGVQTTYYPNKNLVRVVNSSGTFDTYYYYDDSGTLLACKDPDGKKYFYHPDHLGSTTLITDEAGNVVEETSYLPFGEILSGGEDRFTFTGQEKDLTGLMYYGARYYDPVLKKFTQADTLVQDIYNPQNLNRYSYVLNNPYKYTDPTGNFWDVFLDVASIGYDLWELAKDPFDRTNWAALGADIVGAAIPGVTGLGLMVRGAAKVDDVAKVARGADKVKDTVKAADKGRDTVRAVDRGKDAIKVTDKGKDIVKGPGDIEVGRFVGDTRGNVLIEPKGGPIVTGSKDGKYIGTHFGVDAKGKSVGPYQQYHYEHPNALVDKGPHGHTYLSNTKNPSKAGNRIDVDGTKVNPKSDSAHWYNVYK